MTIKAVLPVRARNGAKLLARTIGERSAGLRTGPDFLIVGAKRGGTTSMWNWLLQHPRVLPMFPGAQDLKSSHYFTMHFRHGPRWYGGFFPLDVTRLVRGRGALTVCGEASPYYLFDPRAAGRIYDLLPDVKIIVMLRDPVDRAYSHYRERVHEGVEPLTFEAALKQEPLRLRGEIERVLDDPLYYSRAHDWFSYRTRGEYAVQVARYLELFPPDQVLVLRSEDVYEHPQQTFDIVTTFLGIGHHDLEVRRFNYRPYSGMRDETRQELVNHFRSHNEALYQVVDRDMGWSR